MALGSALIAADMVAAFALRTAVSDANYQITIAAQQTVSGSTATYVTRIQLAYPLTGDFNQNNHVDAADYVLWRKNVTSTTTLPNDNGLGTPITQQHYDLWRANYGNVVSPTSGAGASLLELPADPEARYPAGAVGLATVATSSSNPASQPPVMPGVSYMFAAMDSLAAPAAAVGHDFASTAINCADDSASSGDELPLTALDDAFAWLASAL